MRAILLSAGLGSRLRPLTNVTPKCLVPINGQPILDIWLQNIKRIGCNEFLINMHYLSEKVVGFVKNSPLRESIKLSYEEVLLGTAGTLVKNIDFFQGEDGMLVHADNYTREDLVKFYEHHHSRPRPCTITMMTFKTNNPESCGIVEIDKKGIVNGFHEKVKNAPGNLANGAVYLLSAEAIERVKAISREKILIDFSLDIIPQFLGKIYTYETKMPFIDIGTPERYELAENMDKCVIQNQ